MTFSVGYVEGGTGAGSKRPLLPANTIPWECDCLDPDAEPWTYGAEHRKLNPGYLVRCIDCRTDRDK